MALRTTSSGHIDSFSTRPGNLISVSPILTVPVCFQLY
jgi:hypothetical protein